MFKYSKLKKYEAASVLGKRLDNNEVNTNLQLTPTQTGVIDIVHDFYWNANQIGTSGVGASEIPYVILTEREQVESSVVSSLYYYINNLFNMYEAFTPDGVQSVINNAMTWIEDTVTSTVKMIATNSPIAMDYYNSAEKHLKSILNDVTMLAQNDREVLDEFLKSYLGIYLTRKTGFTYILPYFDDTFFDISNSWSPMDDQLLSSGNDLIEAIAPYVKPGVFIERPQYFSFSTSGRSISVRFPLLNTLEKDSYKRNYEFLWTLGFQNKYYREGYASVRPPKIYTLRIPGILYMPYTYIGNMSVDFVGTRRLMDVDLPDIPNDLRTGLFDEPSKNILQNTGKAIIPDAYMVSITFTSLISDTANTMLSYNMNGTDPIEVEIKDEAE